MLNKLFELFVKFYTSVLWHLSQLWYVLADPASAANQVSKEEVDSRSVFVGNVSTKCLKFYFMSLYKNILQCTPWVMHLSPWIFLLWWFFIEFLLPLHSFFYLDHFSCYTIPWFGCNLVQSFVLRTNLSFLILQHSVLFQPSIANVLAICSFLRQDISLLPFLLIIVVDVLSCIVDWGVELRDFRVHSEGFTSPNANFIVFVGMKIWIIIVAWWAC